MLYPKKKNKQRRANMTNLQTQIKNYLGYCEKQKRLDAKTLKAYSIDLRQFESGIIISDINEITPDMLECYIANLHKNFKPKTVKRKIAAIKAFFHYLDYKDLIDKNPFSKLQIKFREPTILPKTIPLPIMETLLSTLYTQCANATTAYQKRKALRDTAVIELLFATGIRISELCSLKNSDVNLYERSILIYGKGAKERKVQIGNEDVINLLIEYRDNFSAEIHRCNYFFVNPNGSPLSDQSVRRMINKYSSLASIELHITPHMFRHTFATSLLEADVDIRYIQEMLGHSSINVTEIYTHVTMAKQRDILTTKHPRNSFRM